MIARGKRSLTRLLSLGLMVALCLAMAPGMALAAATPTVTFPAAPTISGTQITVPLKITSIAPSFTGNGTIQLVFRWDGKTDGPVSVVTDVYADLITLTQIVYNGIPLGFGGDTLTSSSHVDVNGENVSLIVYVDATTEDDGGGGGGGGTISDTEETDTGWETYDEETDTTTVYVDPDLTEELFTSPTTTEVVLVTPPTTTTSNVEASLPLDVVNQASGSTANSVLDMGGYKVTLTPQDMANLAEQIGALGGTDGSVKLKSETLTETEKEQVLADVKAEGEDTTGMTSVSPMVKLSFVVVDKEGKEHTFTVPTTAVTVKFDQKLVKDPSKVNLYIIGSLIYVGGKVDPVTGTVTANVPNIAGTQLLALEYSKTFTDITGHWAQTDIELMASKYVVQGMTATTFVPDGALTRAQFVTLLARSIGLKQETPATATFTDVASGAWYYGYIEAANKAGLALGYSDGSFKPDATVSRQEMAAFLVRAMKIAGVPAKDVPAANVATLLAGFADAASVSDWAKTEVAQAVNEGLIKGRPGGLYDPLGIGSRAEGATMMSRFMRQEGKI